MQLTRAVWHRSGSQQMASVLLHVQTEMSPFRTKNRDQYLWVLDDPGTSMAIAC